MRNNKCQKIHYCSDKAVAKGTSFLKDLKLKKNVEREGVTDIDMGCERYTLIGCLPYTSITVNRTKTLGMCPYRESNPPLLGVLDNASTN